MAPHCSTLPCNARTRVRARATEFCRSSCRMFSPRTMFVTGFIAGGALRCLVAYHTSLVGGGDCAKTRVSRFISRFSTVHRWNRDVFRSIAKQFDHLSITFRSPLVQSSSITATIAFRYLFITLFALIAGIEMCLD